MKATKYQQKSQIKLEDLLRRRKSTLKQFLKDRGITTYEGLDSTCKRLGVLTPHQSSFTECVDRYVSNPAAGVVVIPPAPVIEESTGQSMTDDEDSFEEFQPQLSVMDESGDSEVSVVLQDASFGQSKIMTKKQKKLMKRSEQEPSDPQ